MSAERCEEAVFEAALKLSAPERAAYLDGACAGDPDLRSRVERLLAAFERAGGFMSQPAAPERILRFSPAPTEKIGDRIGRYKLLEQIGAGGCGVVYVAEQQEPVRRRVALKVIKLGMDTKEVVARFEAERQALAMMDHPNIARVFDAGATDTGRPYFVMELVRGVKITEFCDDNELTRTERLKLFVQVCQAIQHAHQKGIIHRDLKPSNIIVTVNDGEAVPKVIDFGIAKATQGRLTDQTIYTAFEQFIGTPAYMSPEQAVMTSQDIDTRSDVYSLGVLLYELLTGSTPFDSRELLSKGLDEMRRTIRETEPPKPSTRLTQELRARDKAPNSKPGKKSAPSALHSAIPSDLDWIVMKCLEKDRRRRYETANGLAADIQRHLKCEVVMACPPSRLYEFQKMVRRHKFGFAAAGVVAVTLVLGMVGTQWQAARVRAAEREQKRLRQEAEIARGQAQADAQRARTEEAKSEQVAQFMKDMLNEVAPSVALGRDTTLLREILDKTAQRIGVQLTNQPEVEAELSYTLGDVYFGLADFEKAELLHRRALELRHRMAGEDSGAVVLSESHLGRVLLARRRLSEAETLLRQALAQQRKLVEQKPREMIFTIQELAIVLNIPGPTKNRGEAESLLHEALGLAVKAFGSNSMEMAQTLEHLGEVLNLEGKLSQAEAAHKQGLEIRRKLHEDEFGLAEAMGLLTGVLTKEGKFDEAIATGREALAIQRKLYPAESPALAGSLYNLALALQRQGKVDEAEPLYRQAATIWRSKQVSPSSSAAMCMQEWGIMLFRQGKLTEAEAVLREALSRWKAFGTNFYQSTSGTLYRLGCVLYERGAFKEAETALREDLAILEKQTGKPAQAPQTLYTLGQVLCAQGQYDEAVACYRESANQGSIIARDALAQMLKRGEAKP